MDKHKRSNDLLNDTEKELVKIYRGLRPHEQNMLLSKAYELESLMPNVYDITEIEKRLLYELRQLNDSTTTTKIIEQIIRAKEEHKI